MERLKLNESVNPFQSAATFNLAQNSNWWKSGIGSYFMKGDNSEAWAHVQQSLAIDHPDISSWICLFNRWLRDMGALDD